MSTLDKEALLAEIDRRADHHNLLIHAVLAGLAKRIRRGDFDQRENTPLRADRRTLETTQKGVTGNGREA